MTTAGDPRGATTVVGVIVNWNCRHDTVASGQHLLDAGLGLVVVDNASEDAREPDLLRAALPAARVVVNDTNRGYAGGANAGVREAQRLGASHVLLLNPDTEPTPAALKAMVVAAHDADVVGIAQVHLTDDGAQLRYPTAATVVRARPEPADCPGCPAGQHEVDVVTGAALVLRIAPAQAQGLMDESYFHYKEEFDLVHRVRRAGGRVVSICAPAVGHRRGGSLAHTSPQASYYALRNELLFVRKNFGLLELVRMPGLVVLGLRRCLGAGERGRAARQAVVDGLRGVGGRRDLGDLS